MLLSRTKEYTVFVDASIKPTILVPVGPKLIVSKVWERVKEAYSISPQLAVLSGLYHYCRVRPEGARPRDLYKFLSQLGVDIKENTLRAELSYLVRKGIVVKKGGRYRVRDDIDLDDLERTVDINRSRAGREKWLNPSRSGNWRPKHSVEATKLIQIYNIHNLVSHIKALMKQNELRALAILIYFGGGLRLNDKLNELGFKENGFYAIIYETKLNRFRLICGEYDELWRELLKDEEIREWLLKLIKRHNEWLLQCLRKREYKWRISRDEWNLMASSVKRREKEYCKENILSIPAFKRSSSYLNVKGQ
ncbi:MAG: hypothetical protein DRN04_13395 [Thermoprotei archaeon]|nr:MAG: hypothetical protein DRN04_13395 [Thermoprotei archaeon]